MAFIDDYDPSTPMPVTVNAWTTNDTAWADIDRTATTTANFTQSLNPPTDPTAIENDDNITDIMTPFVIEVQSDALHNGTMPQYPLGQYDLVIVKRTTDIKTEVKVPTMASPKLAIPETDATGAVPDPDVLAAEVVVEADKMKADLMFSLENPYQKIAIGVEQADGSYKMTDFKDSTQASSTLYSIIYQNQPLKNGVAETKFKVTVKIGDKTNTVTKDYILKVKYVDDNLNVLEVEETQKGYGVIPQLSSTSGKTYQYYVAIPLKDYLLYTTNQDDAKFLITAGSIINSVPTENIKATVLVANAPATDADLLTSGAVTCYGPNLGKWYVPKEEKIWAGGLGEGPCSSEYDSGEFDAWKTMNLRAAFFGHDHLNDYCGTLEGIDLIATSGLGFYMYGRGEEHGARLITLYAENPSTYDTKMLYYRDIVDAPLPGLFIPYLGVLIQQYVFIGLSVLILIVIIIVFLVRRIKKGKNKNAPAK